MSVRLNSELHYDVDVRTIIRVPSPRIGLIPFGQSEKERVNTLYTALVGELGVHVEVSIKGVGTGTTSTFKFVIRNFFAPQSTPTQIKIYEPYMTLTPGFGELLH